MRNTNKKGFTIVELVIVVAVIAILAAVLIPTFAGIIRQANISSDTVVAKNLNTAVATYGKNVDTFDEAIAAVREAGYYLANLNSKADECYFAWDDDNNQFVVVDGKDNYKVIYSNVAVTTNKAKLMFAISDNALVAKVEAAGYAVKKVLSSVENLKDAIAAGGTIYMDESVALNNENTIKAVDGTVTVVELGSSSLTASETITGQPLSSSGSSTALTVNGGNISATGSSVSSANNQVYNMIGKASNKSELNLNDTNIDVKTNLAFNASDATLNFNKINAKIDTGCFVEVSFGGKVLIKDCNVDIVTTTVGWQVVFLGNTGAKDGETVSGKEAYENFGATTEVVIDGGEYNSYWIAGLNRGTLTIKDGKFNFVNHTTKSTGTTIGGVDNVEYFRFYGTSTANVVIEGGTFNGVDYWEISDADWVKVCRNDTGKDIVVTRDDVAKTITISVAQ